MAINKVIAKYLDGRMLKGSTLDFDPSADFFHLDTIETNEGNGDLGMREVDLSKLKAVFFVKDFTGRPGYKERDDFIPGDERRGISVAIEFQDGEKLNGLSMGFDRTQKGFFVNPVDPDSNNIRIFIIWATVAHIESLKDTRGSGLAINKVIAKYLDGRMLKGSTLDFDSSADFFHLDVIETNEEKREPGMREVDVSKLKAVFFVKDFTGRPGYKERDKFIPGDERSGIRVAIEFQDGEKLNGLSMGFDRTRKGFFVNPVDPDSNNISIFIIWSTVAHIKSFKEVRGSGLAINKVIAKYLDGRMLKGSTLDFDSSADFFHLDVIETNEEDGSLDMREVDLSKLKAVFFVKDFTGRPDYKERADFIPGDERRGIRVAIEFQDGERLNVFSMGDLEAKGFFVNPVDPESNNTRIFIISATVKSIERVG